jgi:hypothetical protein
MGQKINPIGLRLGINRTWDSRWFADGSAYGDLLLEDLALRKMLEKRLAGAGISRIIIERPAKKARITIHSARPGVVIGKKGADIEKLRSEVSKMTGSEVSLNIVEVRKPEIDANLVAENIAQQLERSERYASGGTGCPRDVWRSPGWRGNRANRAVSRGQCAVAHLACRCAVRHCDGPDHLWRLWRQGLDLSR